VSYSVPDVLLGHGHGDTGELGVIGCHYLEHTFCRRI